MFIDALVVLGLLGSLIWFVRGMGPIVRRAVRIYLVELRSERPEAFAGLQARGLATSVHLHLLTLGDRRLDDGLLTILAGNVRRLYGMSFAFLAFFAWAAWNIYPKLGSSPCPCGP